VIVFVDCSSAEFEYSGLGALRAMIDWQDLVIIFLASFVATLLTIEIARRTVRSKKAKGYRARLERYQREYEEDYKAVDGTCVLCGEAGDHVCREREFE
jgi:hypothetical protein